MEALSKMVGSLFADSWGSLFPKDEPYPRVNDGQWLVKVHTFFFYYRLWACTKKYIGATVALVAVGEGYSRMKGQ